MASYDAHFFEDQRAGSSPAAREVVPLVLKMLQPAPVRRVIDVGCGIGAWAAAFREAGVPTVHGVDGDYVDRQMLLIPPDCFTPGDLSAPLKVEGNYDLVVCLEVAEHLAPARAAEFVGELTRLAPVVLFSAAVPGQGGVTHLNEQWQDYWAGHFQRRGYHAIDCLRAKLWDNRRVVWWYAQNTLIYVREDQLSQYPLLQQERQHEGVLPLRIVHPGMYEGLRYFADPQTMGLGNAFRGLCSAVRATCSRRWGRLRAASQSGPAVPEPAKTSA